MAMNRQGDGASVAPSAHIAQDPRQE